MSVGGEEDSSEIPDYVVITVAIFCFLLLPFPHSPLPPTLILPISGDNADEGVPLKRESGQLPTLPYPSAYAAVSAVESVHIKRAGQAWKTVLDRRLFLSLSSLLHPPSPVDACTNAVAEIRPGDRSETCHHALFASGESRVSTLLGNTACPERWWVDAMMMVFVGTHGRGMRAAKSSPDTPCAARHHFCARQSCRLES